MGGATKAVKSKSRKLTDPLKINTPLKPIKKRYRDGGMTPAMRKNKLKVNPYGVPPAMRRKKVYREGGVQGPFTEQTVKSLDERYPGTAMKYPGPYNATTIKAMKNKIADTHGGTTWGAISDLEREMRNDDETYFRSSPEALTESDIYYRRKGGTINKNKPKGTSKLTNPYGVPPAMRNKKVYKTGGMVNSNTKVKADKTAGSKGVKSGVNAKIKKQTTARGRVGGISSAPKTATPKAKYGMSMRKK
jgi:hypothetical protein